LVGCRPVANVALDGAWCAACRTAGDLVRAKRTRPHRRQSHWQGALGLGGAEKCVNAAEDSGTQHQSRIVLSGDLMHLRKRQVIRLSSRDGSYRKLTVGG
jgi:hypothetical protein